MATEERENRGNNNDTFGKKSLTYTAGAVLRVPLFFYLFRDAPNNRHAFKKHQQLSCSTRGKTQIPLFHQQLTGSVLPPRPPVILTVLSIFDQK